jgi:hypothetical protein
MAYQASNTDQFFPLDQQRREVTSQLLHLPPNDPHNQYPFPEEPRGDY